jgi:hypothetical protein
MLDTTGYQVQARQQELLREAEMERLAHEASPNPPAHRRMLAAVGRQLSRVGDSLQNLYGEVYAPSLSPARQNKQS